MATKLYVGNISYSTTDDSLRDAFSKAGNVVSATVVIDRNTGRSRGFAFVEMDSKEAADAAIEMYDGKEVDGRAVKVNEARPMQPRRDFGGGGRGGYNGGGRGGYNNSSNSDGNSWN